MSRNSRITLGLGPNAQKAAAPRFSRSIAVPVRAPSLVQAYNWLRNDQVQKALALPEIEPPARLLSPPPQPNHT
uniref:Uncharacterized protein n=1 Tax=Helicobasidium mompa totivirus 1-17 TaxID=196690 RepID=Q76L26_9VIRU|nr:hypothetical protein [Helicobasidium mompa totivirus 1-17]